MIIPKVIHFIAPEDKSQWHPLWHKCYKSWCDNYPDFEIKLWNDDSDIDSFICNNYNDYYDMFCDFPLHIMKLDFARFCILHYYGGIYSDMDVFCYKNFYDELEHTNYILPAPYGKKYINGEKLIENAIMISTISSSFFLKCIEKCKDNYHKNIKKYIKNLKFPLDWSDTILVGKTAGPVFLSDCYEEFGSNVNVLNGLLYNNHGMSYHPSYRTKHLFTGVWGKESYDKSKDFGSSYIDKVSKYADLESVDDIDKLDFYHDYTNVGMKLSFDTSDHEREEQNNYKLNISYD